jgi:hypothetical protein
MRPMNTTTQRRPVIEAPHTSVTTFVSQKVKHNDMSRQLTASICKYFPRSAIVISAYLTLSDLYWKINFHWDVTRQAVCYLLTLDPKSKANPALLKIRALLDSCSPIPNSGYYQGGKEAIGLPVDRSPRTQITDRPRVVQKAKGQLASLLQGGSIPTRSIRKRGLVNLGIAPVASPAASTHDTGWALDIQGRNSEIHRIALMLGASYTKDELNHVHCEWAQGKVRLPRLPESEEDFAQARQRASTA